MKEKILMIAILMLLPIAAMQTKAASKKTVKWTDPMIMGSNAGELEVKYVEFTDTATILYFNAEANGWIRIARESFLKDERGNKYPLTSADGIVPGKNFMMPKTHKTDFVLRFSPVPKGTKMIDFLEGEKENLWKIFGIHDKNYHPDFGIPKDIRNMKYAKNETLPATKYAPGKVKVRFKAYGYRPEMQVKLNVFNDVIGKKQQQFLSPELKSDGTAEFEVYLTHPSAIVIGIPNIVYKTVFAVPGEDISMVMDLGNAHSEEPFLCFTGSLARTNKEYNELKEVKKQAQNNYTCLLWDYAHYDDSTMISEMRGRTADECTDLLNRLLNERITKVNSIKGITDATRSILRMKVEEENLNWRYHFKQQMTQAHIRKAHIKSAEEYEAITKNLTIPDFGTPLTKDMPPMECLDSDHALFAEFLTSNNPDDFQMPINNSYNKQVALMHHYLCGTTSPEFDIDANITDAAMSKCIADKRAHDKQMEEELAKSGNVFFKKYDDVKPEDILPVIIKKHEGKAVVVDIWATWCGPCKAGHKRMEPLKKELESHDAVFVYITGTTSPVETWQEMIGDIPGEHYYLTAEQYRYILDKYESDGIPTYLIFDRKGNFAFKNIGMISNEKIKEEIDKALKQD